jgi:Ca2+-binding EF-hand superfamily protein
MRLAYSMVLSFAAGILPAFSTAQAATRELPYEIARIIEEDSSRAIDRFGRIMTGISADGTISEMAIRRREMVEDASQRARRLSALLALDLDNDGQVIDLEITASFEAASTRDRRELLVLTAAADKDRNNIITFEEMRLAAAESVRGNRRSARDMSFAYDMLVFDLDNSGDVTMREMMEAVERFSPKCSCVE